MFGVDSKGGNPFWNFWAGQVLWKTTGSIPGSSDGKVEGNEEFVNKPTMGGSSCR